MPVCHLCHYQIISGENELARIELISPLYSTIAYFTVQASLKDFNTVAVCLDSNTDSVPIFPLLLLYTTPVYRVNKLVQLFFQRMTLTPHIFSSYFPVV